MANPRDDLWLEFLAESRENLEQLENDVLSLERSPDRRPVLDRVFRTIHTLKGSCGFLGLDRLGALTHLGESLLTRLRDGDQPMTVESADALLALVDAVREILQHVERHGAEGPGDDRELLLRLHHLGTTIHEGGVAANAEPGPQAPDAAEPPADSADSADSAESSVRVDVTRLDRLMNLVGELVLVRNQILQSTASRADSRAVASSRGLDFITSELQEEVMKTRMQPIDRLWSKLPRLTRDVAAACGKQVRLEMTGHDTELDRTLLEAIKDPITHLLRNAIDHGIEPPRVRLAAGKPAHGSLRLRAFHEGGQVNLEIADDGAGMDPERLRRHAVERGLLTSDEAARLTEREALQLVFRPGFTTAASVTSVSGRGVGMDVVRTNIEKIGGTLDLQTDPGQGTTLRVRIPLTLAIIPALMVTARGARYAIAQTHLLELLRTSGRSAIERVHGAPVIRLRGELLPLVDLNAALGADPSEKPAHDGRQPIVVLRADDRTFGLMVDEVHDTAEIVVKPLGRHLQGIPCFAGATILGDGRVALILDVVGLAQGAALIEASRDGEPKFATPADAVEHRSTRVLVFDAGASRRMAIPLPAISRLERIAPNSIEPSAGRSMVQLRDGLLTLRWLDEALGEKGRPFDGTTESLHVAVCATPEGPVGLILGHIVDLVETPLDLHPVGDRFGIAGAAVIQGRVTDVLDVPALLGAATTPRERIEAA